jgi:hypothetical protein
MSDDGFMSHEMTTSDPAERRSLDVVQRTVVSILVGVVIGLFAAVLALYLVLRGHQDLDHGSVVGLWIMTGVIGLITAGVILVINRKKPYHPLVLVGLFPMALSWYGVFH